MDKILILDYGSQTTQLIGRRIRELGVYTEILPGDADLGEALAAGTAVPGPAGGRRPEDRSENRLRGIILSGSPESVYTPEGAAPDPRIYSCGLPLLGICYGLQRMNVDNGGTVEPLPKREYGGVKVTVRTGGVPPAGSDPGRGPGPVRSETFTAWMSHGDTLTTLAPGFLETGTSETGYPAVVVHREKPWYGLQFHPEVTHCERGMEILSSFVFGICRCKKNWSMKAYMKTVKAGLAARVKDAPVLLLVSGGVDSTVAAALLLTALDPDQVHLMYMDTGLMRKDETLQVKAALEKLGARHLHIVLCEEEFLSALAGLSDPEEKRKTIGDLFITLQEREVARLGLPETYFLAQGTLYTDMIESGRGVGKKAHVIKSHHNVGSPLVEAKRQEGRIVEPLDKLYKDEVRSLGKLLGVDKEALGRHPFPGPGLAVRILGEVTREKCGILREADAVFIRELKGRKSSAGNSLYDEIWQAFAALLPIRSVGVAGDVRKYGWILALRAVTSADGMTAGVYPFPSQDLIEISTLITNTVKEIGRVTYDISSKPPATIEWE
ncbi:MAG: glutamine-hydrolyzing GMP synthase [Spirochaetaceae bacterium]|jgi:GMP synthase (glutamine-hydrolysing)|nr:glutamine-hydrolyzing GMP synthase [Spirochaetaceae bacterium]